jgi:hypothetical protein
MNLNEEAKLLKESLKCDSMTEYNIKKWNLSDKKQERLKILSEKYPELTQYYEISQYLMRICILNEECLEENFEELEKLIIKTNKEIVKK